MGENSKIEWTDHTFNPWIGCTHVSEGCRFCYAETMMDKRLHHAEWGPGKPRVRTSAANWKKPLAWNTKSAAHYFCECAACGRREFRKWDNSLPPGGLSFCSDPDCLALSESESDVCRPRVFCASSSDWLDPEVPIEWLADLLELIAITPHLDWLLLTKRPELWYTRIEQVFDFFARDKSSHSIWPWLSEWTNGEAPSNVWMGVSVENQKAADTRIPTLLRISKG